MVEAPFSAGGVELGGISVEAEAITRTQELVAEAVNKHTCMIKEGEHEAAVGVGDLAGKIMTSRSATETLLSILDRIGLC